MFSSVLITLLNTTKYFFLIISRRGALLWSKSTDWFLYDNDLRHEGVKGKRDITPKLIKS